MLKSDWKMNKEKWLLLLVCGVILLILAFPAGEKNNRGVVGAFSSAELEGKTSAGGGAVENKAGEAMGMLEKNGISSGALTSNERAYEEELEKRVTELLKNMQGVGEADVMITLKSSKEKIYHVDKDKSRSTSEEKDSAGGSRTSMSEEIKENTLMVGGSSLDAPVIEKELQPEIAGIVICAQGGGSAFVKAEISEAMEALFGIPSHKIKVLKRVE